MEVQFTMPRKSRMRVDAGLIMEVFTPTSPAERKRVAGLVGIQDSEIIKYYRELEADPRKIIKLTLPDPPPPSFTVTRRLMTESTGIEYTRDTPLEALDAALEGTHGDLLHWRDRDKLCVLDIDYHGRDVPDNVGQLIGMLRPRSSLLWRSRSGGVHATYCQGDVLTAAELAAAGGLGWLNLDRTATFDLVTQVRVPNGDITHETPTQDVSFLRWLDGGASDPDSIATFVADRGWDIGSSYPHENCPVAPCPSHGVPVNIGVNGVFCHRCSGLGVCFGSRRPGFFPWSALIHGDLPNVVQQMVRRFTHWEHARVVLGNLFQLPDGVLQLGYSALLKLTHGVEDERVARALTAGNDILRLAGRWGTRNCLGTYDKKLDQIVATLPACQAEGGGVIGELVARFQQRNDLSEYGYPDVRPIRGIRIYSHHLPVNEHTADVYTTVVPSEKLSPPALERYRPKYVKDTNATTITAAWDVVDSVFPGISRPYLELLIAAKGCSEGQVGLPPMVLVTGPTAAGKTQTCHLAAAMTGDTGSECGWNRNLERFRQALQEAAHKGSYFIVNEILKDAERQGSSAIQALDVFLNVTPGSVAHVLYVGPVALGRVPVCVCTEVSIPQRLRDDAQIARRFVYVPLNTSHKEWQGLSADSGLNGPDNFRIWAEGRGAQAADVIVSSVIDKYFRVPMTFEAIATDLGFTMLCDSPDFDDPAKDLREFWDQYELSPTNDLGFKYINRGDETPIALCWERLCDGTTDDQWYTSRRINECDWRSIIGSEHPMKLVLKKKRSTLLLKFQERR